VRRLREAFLFKKTYKRNKRRIRPSEMKQTRVQGKGGRPEQYMLARTEGSEYREGAGKKRKEKMRASSKPQGIANQVSFCNIHLNCVRANS